ncbi:hypothetical protein C2G38_1214147 [Gigaspora rosea]|uniref:Uncharacterized protein n=1 Tax=Gigaspora rosea TaxID=44941 RepID=A0A397VGT8_9GLOM|nr:hypothetical protein C2G38_1214147 [Gigaspora rosea]
MIVIPDEFNSRRNDLNGICKYCGHHNISPAWCQSCDPWKATQEWTSGNEGVNKLIKEIQFKATEYEKVIEWIPFAKLINLLEIKELSELAFMATWVKGVRTIKGESGKYVQSRTKSSVDLLKMNYSQPELLKDFKVLQEKYKIHGITQNTETGQYVIVIDFYNEKRNSVNGICEYCNDTIPIQLGVNCVILQECSREQVAIRT